MTEEKKGIKQILSDTIESLSYIYNIIDFSSEEEESPLLKKKWSFVSIISDIRRSLLTTFLSLTDNELRILDYIIKYKAITARHLCNFLQVSKRQVYRYVSRLQHLNFVTSTKRQLGNGPVTRFFHFPSLSLYQLDAAEALERASTSPQEEVLAVSDNHHYECEQCGTKWWRAKTLGVPTKCVHCKGEGDYFLQIDKTRSG